MMETGSLQCGRNPKLQQHRQPLPSDVLNMMELNLGHGAMQSRVVTAPQSKNSSGMSSRFKPHEVRLLPSLQMDQSLHGAIQDVVVIALKFKNSSGMYSTFSPLHELGSQQMHMQAAPPFAAILANGSIVTWGHPEWGGDSSGFFFPSFQEVRFFFSPGPSMCHHASPQHN